MAAQASAGEVKNVEGNLQDYLDGKGLNTLFVQIVEHLLLDTPDNPVRYVIDFLRSNFPEQAKDQAFHRVAGQTEPESFDLTGDLNAALDGDSSDDEDEDEDDAELLANMNRANLSLARRAAVCGESVDPRKLSRKLVTATHAKSDAVAARLGGILRRNTLFAHLDGDQRAVVVDAMYPLNVEPGHVVVKQGDRGDHFYVVDSGECEVFVTRDDGESERVMACADGDSFGELALMYDAPRAATVRAVAATNLWVVDRPVYKHALMDLTIRKRHLYKSFLDDVKILGSLTEYERLTVADALSVRMFKKGDVIIRQHDAGDDFFVVEKGEVVCSQQVTLSSRPVEIARLAVGSYFGEIALLTNRPRAATVVADADEVRCLCLNRRTFMRVMGPLTEIMKRNLHEYKRFISEKI